jgi:uncharacterized membrane protein/nitrite reductase/ring-hydroxylating ferredoxin subunit
MRSAANFRGHPIHPSVIPFPFAFLWGAFVADLIGVVFDLPTFGLTGWYLAAAGVIMALLAAVPGFIDYFRTVPPESSAHERATKHMLLNLSTVALFAISFLMRLGETHQPSAVPLIIEAIGVVMLSMAGWMGGVLVSRNQISVDHRYAHAGKWREERVHAKSGEFVTVARADELRVDQMKLVHVGDRRVVLARTEAGHVAFADGCTHKGGSLADGVLICGVVQCPWHGSQFDCASGQVKAGPAAKAIATYEVREENQEVRLRLDHSA